MSSPRQDKRLDPSPAQVVDRSAVVAFEFDGKRVEAYSGDTVGSALYASGVRVFSRSFKYHRPRGLLCMAGRCANCLVSVDGVPNVRACTEPVRAGMVVRHQNAWPSLDTDFLSVLDKLDRLMPVGFYYKALHRPKMLWRIAGPLIRRAAGLGVIDTKAPAGAHYGHQSLSTDVAVGGGGPAGLSAALEASRAGAQVTLVDDQPSLGGHLRFDVRRYEGLPGFPAAPGFEIGAELAEAVMASESIEVMLGASAFGLYEGNLLGVLTPDRLVKLRASQIVVATGSYETPAVFESNDVPGVVLGSGASRLIRLYGIKPGSVAVVATAGDEGYHLAADLLDAGVRVAAVSDARPEFPHGLAAAESLRSRGILILSSHAVRRAEGTSAVEAAILSHISSGAPTGEERRVECDLICVSGEVHPASALLQQGGAKLRHDAGLGENVPSALPAGLHAVGDVTGLHDLAASLLQGRIAGAEAAAACGSAPASPSDLEAHRRDLSEIEARYQEKDRAADVGAAGSTGKKRFVCLCEDVTANDVADAVGEGFRDIQTLKRYSTVTMGPCQGKMCLPAVVGICARETGRTAGEIGSTTLRPPVQPVPLGALAGPSHMPIKRTPIDRKHVELGAQMVDVGLWQRPYSYTTPQEESLAVRNRVGIIDVSTLGKLDVRGRDAGALLDKVYTHRFSDLRVGRIRYGVLCSDTGAIIDDGTVARLGDEHYFVTTTTGNVELIEEWFKWWMAGTEMCAHVTNVTSAYAAINVAGPRSRETLMKLTDIDLDPAAFRYMRAARGEVAGVPSLLLRIGFVGETGWEVHFPAEYGEYMWDALMHAGSEFGIAPFGLEAQRILRLEKKHVIVSQDTDSMSNPLESDMSWVVRFDKEDFIGKAGLLAAQEWGGRIKLVGFVMTDSLVPDDGAPIVDGGAPVGHVTSSRLSPTTGKGFGLAWVPTELAEDGRTIAIRVAGKDVAAQLSLEPIYDPEGKRLRE